MAGEWVGTTIGELLANDGGSVKTGPFGTTLKAKEYSRDGVPLISVGEVGYGSLRLHDKTPRVPREVVERLPEYLLKSGDIVFGRKGAVDRSALVKPEQAGWFLGSDGIRLRLPTTCNARFMAYQLQSERSRSWLLQHATGTTMASLNQTIIERVPVLLPPLREQRAIAHILGTLDDKIELNLHMNEALEAVARALFKSWFVDFDPVRAKAEGRNPGLPQPLADLFPDSFEDSELGGIPRGWAVATIGDACEVIDCLHSKKPERRESGLPLLQLSNIRHDGLLDMTDTYSIAPADYKQWIGRMEASTGDCVITNVGRVGAVARIPSDVKAALGRNMTGVRCKASFPYSTFLIECLLSESMAGEVAMQVDTGTILDALNVRNIPKLRLVKPSNDLLDQFEILAHPLRRGMEVLLAESRTLAELRDTLLPKLISGAIQVTGGAASGDLM